MFGDISGLMGAALGFLQIKNTKDIQSGQLEIARNAQILQQEQREITKETIAHNSQMAKLRHDEVMANLFVRIEEFKGQLEQKALDRNLTIEENEKTRVSQQYLKKLELMAIAENQARQLAHTSEENAKNRAFTVAENEKTRVLNEYLKKLELDLQLTIHYDQQALQKWKAEWDRETLILSKTLDSQNQIALANVNNANSIEQLREKRRMDKSPLNTLVCDIIEQWLRLDDPFTLVAIYSPPVLQYEPSQAVIARTPHNFPDCQYELEQELLQFQQIYKTNHRNIKLHTGEWVSKYIQGTAAITSIYSDGDIMPTFILDIPINSTKAFFNVSYWEPDFKEYEHFPALSKPLPWQELGENLVTVFSLISRLWLGFIVDTHYLIHVPLERRQTPLLPTLLPSLFEELPQEYHDSFTMTVINYYEQLYNTLAQAEPQLIPDLRLDLVLALAQLPTQFGAKQQLIASLQNWLQCSQINPSKELNDLLNQVSANLYPNDQPYVEKLNRCLKALNLNHALDIATSCYQRGLQSNQAGKYQSACADFDRTISLNPHVEAYYQRAIAHYGLATTGENANNVGAVPPCPPNSNYGATTNDGATTGGLPLQNAIADLDKAIALQPHRAELYDLRGDVYHKLGNYELALANYNQAVSLGHPSQKRDNLQQQWNDQFRRDEEERKRKEAEAARQRAEEEAARKRREAEATRKRAEEEAARKRREAEAARQRAEEEERRRALILPLPNNQTLELVWIPKGTLKMEGSHTINLSEFRMGKYPVTQAQYQAVMGNNPSYFGRGSASVPALENHPVESVNWFQAREFCQKLTEHLKKQGLNLKIDLPSETQWEYACRAGTTTKYWFGNNDADLKKHAWYDDNSGSTTHSVHEAEDTHTNPWGLVDMHGNVWEWCKDEWTGSVSQLPTDGSAYGGDNDNRDLCALSGGSWCLNSFYCAAASRYYYFARFDYVINGFRLVCVFS